jgi:hypothetical protein
VRFEVRRENNEYTDFTGFHVSTSISVSVATTDLGAAPKHAPKTRTVLAEVARIIPARSANGYYPVYTDIPRGRAGYCA